MQNNSIPSTDVAPAAAHHPSPNIAPRSWTKVLGQGVGLGVFVVFAIYVADLIVLPLLTDGRIEDFIASPDRALQKLLMAFAIGIAIAFCRPERPRP